MLSSTGFCFFSLSYNSTTTWSPLGQKTVPLSVECVLYVGETVQQVPMSLKPHQYMFSLNSSCSVFASQYYANICQNSLWDYWKKTTAWKVSAYFVFPVLLRFRSLIIALQIGKSSFQLWQVTIIPAFILISSGKRYNRSIWIRWIFFFFIVFRCEDKAAPKKKAKSYCDDCGIQPYICKNPFCREVIWWGYFQVTLNQHPIHHFGSYINSRIPKEKCSLRGSNVKDVLDLSTDLK